MSKLDKSTIVEVVRRLIGATNAVGDHHTDEIRLGNLGTTIHVVECLAQDIADAAGTADRQQASMAEIGQAAKAALIGLRDSLIEEFPL